MSTAVIDRIGFDKFLSDARIDLANQAASKLGYKRLANAIAVPGALLGALRELDIEPLSPKGVNAYKASKEYTGMWSGTKGCIAGFVAVVAEVTLIGLGIHLSCYPLSFGMSLAAVITLIGTIANCDDNWGYGKRVERKWETFGLEGYKGNVPEGALLKALQIKERCPDVKFHVDQLVETTNERKAPLPDPFLVATQGYETYYIEVWDEKEYERKW